MVQPFFIFGYLPLQQTAPQPQRHTSRMTKQQTAHGPGNSDSVKLGEELKKFVYDFII
jgi:hypothetical protein